MTPPFTGMALLCDAMHLAAERHASQRRKGSGDRPYVNHPVEVTHLLAVTAGSRDAILLAAALLHDTLEDTTTTPAELESRFGVEVRTLVEEVTDDKSLPEVERKARQVAAVEGYSEGAKMIRIADKISNVCDVTKHPPKDWSLRRRRKYLSWAEEVVARCRGVSEPLEECFEEELQRARRVLAELEEEA